MDIYFYEILPTKTMKKSIFFSNEMASSEINMLYYFILFGAWKILYRYLMNLFWSRYDQFEWTVHTWSIDQKYDLLLIMVAALVFYKNQLASLF